MLTSTAMAWKEADLDTFEKRSKHTVSVIGCGRTGLSTACLFAKAGFRVICVDSNPYIVSQIKKGKTPFGDPELAQSLRKHLKEERISATRQAKEAASTSDVITLAVPPVIDVKKKPDYSNMENASKEVGLVLRSGSVVIVENTLGPGTTETIVKEALEKASGLTAGIDFGLAYANIHASSSRMFGEIGDRPIVMGSLNEKNWESTNLILRHIVKAQIVKVKNIKTAEATNLFENVYHDVNQALTNELALFCEKMGIDYFDSQKALNKQTSCNMPDLDVLNWHFSTAPHLLLAEAENLDLALQLSATARKINAEMLNHTLRLTRDALKSCGKSLRRARVTIFGVSGSRDLTDLRQSFVKHLVTQLTRNGARVQVYDPLFSQKQLIELEYPAEETFRKSIEGADCLIYTVAHDRFKRLSLNRIKFYVKNPAAIVDLANAFNPDEAKKAGFLYHGLGRS